MSLQFQRMRFKWGLKCSGRGNVICSALRFGGLVKLSSNHKTCDLKPPSGPLHGNEEMLRFGLRDSKSLAVCDLGGAGLQEMGQKCVC